MANVAKVVEAVVVGAKCPFQSTERVTGPREVFGAHTEIRIGGRECYDGFIRLFVVLEDGFRVTEDLWTGHFRGVKFTLNTEELVFLLEHWAELSRLDKKMVVCSATFGDAKRLLEMPCEEYRAWHREQKRKASA